MPKVKLTIAVLLAALTLSAVAASSASADWYVSGTKLATGATVGLATTAKVDTDQVIRIAALGSFIKILCNGTILLILRVQLDPPNVLLIEHLILEGCSTIEPATKCVLTNSQIETEPIKAVATKGAGSSDRLTFTPATKTTFAQIPFSEKNTCLFNEPEPINGAFTVGAPTGQTEEVGQAIEDLGSTENNSLEVAGDKIYLEGGRVLLTLLSGSKWSFR
jgi:hypothetical protein